MNVGLRVQDIVDADQGLLVTVRHSKTGQGRRVAVLRGTHEGTCPVRACHDAVTVADQGGWKRNSTALYGYLRRVDQWSDNALEGIGL